MERVGGFGERMERHPNVSLAGMLSLERGPSTTLRYPRKRDEIEVEPVTMCTKRLEKAWLVRQVLWG